MILHLGKQVKNGCRHSIVGSIALEAPHANESHRVTPRPSGHGGAMVPCWGKKDGEQFHVELTRRDLIAICEAAGILPADLTYL